MFNQRKDKPTLTTAKAKGLLVEYMAHRLKMDQQVLERDEDARFNQFRIHKDPQSLPMYINPSQPQWKIWLDAQEFMEWRMDHNSHILFFDGASKRNPWVECAGGTIFDPG